MGKRISLLLAFLAIVIVSIYADSFRFSIVWDNVIASETSFCVVKYEDDTQLQTKALYQTTETQNVARIKYTTNDGGNHTLVYKATPLQNDSDPNGYQFSIFFKSSNTNPTPNATINVGNNKQRTYPHGTLENSAKTVLAMGNSGVVTTQYITIQVQVTDLNLMRQDTQYSSTITIERVTE